MNERMFALHLPSSISSFSSLSPELNQSITYSRLLPEPRLLSLILSVTYSEVKQLINELTTLLDGKTDSRFIE